MSTTILAEREGDQRIVPIRSVRFGPCDDGSASGGQGGGTFRWLWLIDVDLAQLDGIDGTGPILLARLLDRLDVDGRHAASIEGSNDEAARLIARYRERRADIQAPPAHRD